MSSRADRLLCCAVAFSKSEVEEVPIPLINNKSSVDDVIQSMMNVLWVEAKECMNEVLNEIPNDPYLHAVDINSEEPGIVSSKNKIDIHRRKLPVPRVTYTSKPLKTHPVFDDILPQIPFDKAMVDAEKEMSKCLKKNQKNAIKDMKSEMSSLEKIKNREELKEKRRKETKEEREERLTKMREKRAEKKAEKESQMISDENDISQTETEKKEENKERENEKKDDEIYVEKKLDAIDPSANIDSVNLNVQELLESEASADKSFHNILPCRLKAIKNRKTRFYQSPVPFDRHLAALQYCDPCENIKQAVLAYEQNSCVKLIQGPPGTGKTKTLIDFIDEFPNERIYVCAPTNVGTASLYSRILKSGKSCSLLMPPSKIPPGTPLTSQDPSCRIVCSTISGRSGPILDSQEFEVILVDEAGQCMEAWFWGLLRNTVKNIVMVGDTRQLPALVSVKGKALGHDRSLMQRLIENDYPYEMLKVQRRMHPDIAEYPNKMFYDNFLTTDYKNDAFESENAYTLYNVRGECKAIGTSFVNDKEARYCVTKAEEVKNKTKDIVIICPYQAQARQILSYAPNVEVHTIDSFQGREADIVILSMVRTDECGFWIDPRRICVALTRAKHELHVVTSCDNWIEPLLSLSTDAKNRQAFKLV